MRITIPIYCATVKGDGEERLYEIRPVFFPTPVVREASLSKATSKLAVSLRDHLRKLAVEFRHEALVEYAYCPELAGHKLDVHFELRKRTFRGRFYLVSLKALGRRLAFAPTLPDLWFEIPRGDSLADRAAEVLADHFRQREKSDGDNFQPPEFFALAGSAWVTDLELDVNTSQSRKQKEENLFAMMASMGEVDGETELGRVGRCLDDLYPDQLDRVVLRDSDVAELTRLLSAADQRPVLLVGPRQAGKTALIHEYVFNTVAERKSPYRGREQVWLLSPQRLISGMSFVGQWENRLLAILKHAHKRRHVLYFDDLLGLFQAGVSAQSDLNVAHVMKPYLERREVRVLAEITPEAYRVLRERDRGLADQFHVLRVPEPNEADSLRMLIHVARQLESQHKCRFDLDVLPLVFDLHRRYVRSLAFPGKAAAFLRRLAMKHRDTLVLRYAALEEFQAQHGLRANFVDSRVKLTRGEILNQLRQEIVGQSAAIDACADVLSIAKARLNDPERPLASLLFLGPTGVGKTQCAKALAKLMLGDEERLLRYDMNEFNAYGAAARLVGTFRDPEGLLTSAIRRQPFAVILFDEIEKAHPDVFDVLLQVLGEGRLTDALGRTADFTNTIIVLTSNLGVRKAETSLGFGGSWTTAEQAVAADDHVYVKAAECFFRPEFFNRLDRIIPFTRLSRDDVANIARMLLTGVLAREGVARRKCLLNVEPAAMDRIVDAGYDPLLGARALKRALEKHLVQPVAAHLAADTRDDFQAVHVYPGRGGPRVHVQPLAEVEPISTVTSATYSFDDPRDVVARIAAAMQRVRAELIARRPAGSISLQSLRPEQLEYFALQEQMDTIREQCAELAVSLQTPRRSQALQPGAGHAGAGAYSYYIRGGLNMGLVKRNTLRELGSVQDIHEYMKDLAAEQPKSADQVENQLRSLLRQTALMDLSASSFGEPVPQAFLVQVRDVAQSNGEAAVASSALTPIQRYANSLMACLIQDMGVEARWIDEKRRAMLVSGTLAAPLLALEQGTHLFSLERGQFSSAQLLVRPLDAATRPGDLRNGGLAAPAAEWSAWHSDREAWLQRLSAGEAAPADDPYGYGPVIRMYDIGGRVDSTTTLDFRTRLVLQTHDCQAGLVDRSVPTYGFHEGNLHQSMAVFWLSALSLPIEFQCPPITDR